jgi:hypothetical protein
LGTLTYYDRAKSDENVLSPLIPAFPGAVPAALEPPPRNDFLAAARTSVVIRLFPIASPKAVLQYVLIDNTGRAISSSRLKKSIVVIAREA